MNEQKFGRGLCAYHDLVKENDDKYSCIIIVHRDEARIYIGRVVIYVKVSTFSITQIKRLLKNMYK